MGSSFESRIFYSPDHSGGIGRNAENRAVNIIGTSRYVESVIHHPLNSNADRQGKDLTVLINDQLAIDRVFVQVKASSSVKRQFWDKLKRKGLSTRAERVEWMSEEAYVLLVVGERNNDEILADFEHQLLEVDYHWVVSRRDR